MSVTGKVKYSVEGIGTTLLKEVEATGTGAKIVSEPIPDSSSDLEVSFTLDISETKLFFMVADQDLTVKTNSDSVPQETISLTAGDPLVFSPDTPGASAPFAGDVTALFVSNASGSAATLDIRALEDLTP